MGHGLDVEPAGCDIRGDQQLDAPVTKALHHPVALLLRETPVQRGRSIPVGGKRFGEFVHFSPRATEHDGRGRVLHVQHASKRSELVLASDDIRGLPNPGHGAHGGLVRTNGDPHRILQVRFGQRGDARCHRCRQQRDLSLGWNRLEYRLEILGETHVEHFVGLVEHHEPDLCQLEGSALDVVQGASWRCNDDVDAPLQRPKLLLDRLSTIYRDDAGAERRMTVFVDCFGHLHRKLARRNQDERPRSSRLGPATTFIVNSLQERKGKGSRLAGAGRRLPEQVTTLEQWRYGFALNGSRFFIPEGTQCIQQFRGKAEAAESMGYGGRHFFCRGHEGLSRWAEFGEVLARPHLQIDIDAVRSPESTKSTSKRMITPRTRRLRDVVARFADGLESPRGLWGLGVVVVLALGWHARHLVDGQWVNARGYEFEWIAEPLSKGHGYTFASTDSWLGPYDNALHPTAWVEPVQTGVMALAFRALPEHGKLLLVLLNYLWFAVCSVVVFAIGRRLGSSSGGAVAAIAFAALPTGKEELRWYLGNSALAAALISLVALSLLVMLERPTLRRGAVLGLLLGTLALTHAGTLLFLPFAAVVAIVASNGVVTTNRWANGIVVLLAALVVVLPWTVRNYRAFGEIVPVRTGLGQNLHYALPAAAHTIRPDLDLGPGWSSPPWTARGARDAVSRMTQQERWRELRDYSLASGRASGPDDYGRLNEAERDAVLRDQSIDFVREHPGVAIRLGIAKAYGFFWGNWPGFRPVTLLAFIGALIAMRRRRGWIIGGLILLYVIPYTLSAPLYYRYRASIEPLMFVLAGVTVGLCLDLMLNRVKSRKWWPRPATA